MMMIPAVIKDGDVSMKGQQRKGDAPEPCEQPQRPGADEPEEAALMQHPSQAQ